MEGFQKHGTKTGCSGNEWMKTEKLIKGCSNMQLLLGNINFASIVSDRVPALRGKMNMDRISNKDTECRLQIGDVCCSLRFNDPDYSLYVKEYYKGHISEKEPDLTIDIMIDVAEKEEANITKFHLPPKTVNGNTFDLYNGLIKGTLNWEGKRCAVSLEGKSVGTFKQFMFSLYYTLLKHNYPSRSKNNFLVHACAVSRGEAGYVFSGPSGSGKSTIANLSSNYRVLNDDIVMFKKENGSYIVSDTPFHGEFLNSENGSAPLKAIFLIKHGDGTTLVRKISKRDFISRFVREVVFSESLLSTNREKVFQEMMDFCTDVASEVPFYELQFLPDRDIWDSIDNIKEVRVDDFVR